MASLPLPPAMTSGSRVPKIRSSPDVPTIVGANRHRARGGEVDVVVVGGSVVDVVVVEPRRLSSSSSGEPFPATAPQL